MTNKKQKPTTAYDWEKVAKAALIELKVQTSINELNKGSRKFEPSAVGPLRMIVEQQFSLNDSGKLFHTSHLSDKLLYWRLWPMIHRLSLLKKKCRRLKLKVVL